MNTPASVMGCSSCGALYSPSPGDKGVCDDCRSLLPPDPTWRAGGASTSASSPKPGASSPKPVSAPKPKPQPIASISNRPASSFSAQRPNFRRSRTLQRAAIAAVCVAALGGGAAWLITHQRSLSDLQRAIKRQSPAEAWTAIERHASKAWVELKKLWPFGDSQSKRSGPSTPTPSRDATASHSTHRRAPPAQLATSSNKKKSAKRLRDDFSTPGSTP